MKKWTKQFFVFWIVIIIVPMLMMLSMIGNTYDERTRLDNGRLSTVEKEITVSDVLESFVVFALGTAIVMFWVTREPIQEKPKKRRG